jgi:hypothetical protein
MAQPLKPAVIKPAVLIRIGLGSSHTVPCTIALASHPACNVRLQQNEGAEDLIINTSNRLVTPRGKKQKQSLRRRQQSLPLPQNSSRYSLPVCCPSPEYVYKWGG